MKKQKTQSNNKGITLIALVITIIVMLILVAVTITMAVNGGLFNYAGDASRRTNTAVTEEQNLASGRIKVGDTWYDSLQDYIDKKPSANQGDDAGDGTGTARNYNVGDIVSIGTETFYVLQECSETDNTIVLLAKDNIDIANLVQSTTNASTVASSDAALAANNYGAKLEGNGRLMTYNEANGLVGAQYRRMILGSEENLWYWLGSTASADTVYGVLGANGINDSFQGDPLGNMGVRPVVEISKNKVTFVSENAFLECATCNNTGIVTGYVCPEPDCGKISATIETQTTYSGECNPNTGCGGTTFGGLTYMPEQCPDCGGNVIIVSQTNVVNYTECGHSTTMDGVPASAEVDCSDCEIRYVVDNSQI